MPATDPKTPPAKDKQKELVLVAVAGDLEPGDETPIPSDKPLLVGRSARGLQLTDPLVSIQHAEIRHEPRRGWVVEDLKSATGTWVDEECVKGDSRPIGVGTRLRFGDTVFEVQSAHRTPTWMRWVAIAVALLGALALVLLFAQGVAEPPTPSLTCQKSGVLLGRGRALPTLPVPPEFLRTRGVSLGDLACEDVTDHDYDGRDEVWLSLGPSGDAVITFGPSMEWTVLGEFPEGCNKLGTTDGPDTFPEVDCGDERWLLVDGRYRPVSHEGVVVWYREQPSREAPGPAHDAESPKEGEPPPIERPGLSTTADAPLKVGRFSLKNNDRLGAFLAVRGVTEPVHYVICEEAFEGVRAQALTERGQVVDLAVGCISDLRLEGIEAKPVAFALSPTGRRALVDDVVRFYAGSADGLFLERERADLVAAMKAKPGYLKGAVRLVGDSKESDAARFDPMPDPGYPAEGIHVLVNRDSRLEAAPHASTVAITKAGRSTSLDPPGCASLVAEVNDFRSYGLYSLLPLTFITIYDVGCQETPRKILRTRYGSGTWDARLPGADVRLVTESGPSSRGLEILRARITWRERPPGR